MLVQTYEDVVARDRPNYWWRVKNNVDTTVPNTGVLTNSILARGKATTGPAMNVPGAVTGGSCWFTGNSSTATNLGEGYQLDPTVGLVLPASDFITYELWVYPHTTFTSARRYGLLWMDDSSASTTYGGLTVVDYTVDWQTGNILQGHYMTSAAKLVPNVWNHVVATAGAASNTRHELWVNGVPKTITASWGTGPQVFGGLNRRLRLGRAQTSTTFSPPCALAEPAIYPYALSPTQIVEHYQLGLGIRMRPSVRGALGFPFPQAAPAPGGLTSIGDVTNRRIALVSDRPR